MHLKISIFPNLSLNMGCHSFSSSVGSLKLLYVVLFYLDWLTQKGTSGSIYSIEATQGYVLWSYKRRRRIIWNINFIFLYHTMSLSPSSRSSTSLFFQASFRKCGCLCCSNACANSSIRPHTLTDNLNKVGDRCRGHTHTHTYTAI